MIKVFKVKQFMVVFEGLFEIQIVLILTIEVNSSLVSYGGEVCLICLEDDIVILQFGGGCQGCLVVDMTLKDGVQRTLMECIPELKGVRDVIDHS